MVNTELLGVEDGGDDDFPLELQGVEQTSLLQTGAAPDVATRNKAPLRDQAERCKNVGGKPDCAAVLDKLDQMDGEITERLNDAKVELTDHNAECKRIIDELNLEIKTSLEIKGAHEVEEEKAAAFHSSLSIEHGNEMVIKHDICEDMRKTYTECFKQLTELRRQMCGLLRIRNAVYRAEMNADGSKPEVIIEDCTMSAWKVGACSQTCIDANGRPGVQLIQREKKNDWTNA